MKKEHVDSKFALIALKLAMEAHDGQEDKAGAPYIFHCIQVGMSFQDYYEMAVGFLHDFLEDADLFKYLGLSMTVRGIFEALFYDYSDEIINQLVCDLRTLRKSHNRSYSEYIKEILSGSITAIKVKKADLKDNLRPDRLEKLATSLGARLVQKYAPTLKEIEKYEKEHGLS